MSEQEKDQSFLRKNFQEFYSRLEELKKKAVDGTWAFSEGESSSQKKIDKNDPQSTSSHIYQQLVRLFEEQQMAAGKSGEMGNKLYQDALFVMTAIADEVFLTMSWAGQEAWSRFLLETKFFGSNAGGDIFFQKLESLLKERDPVYAELAIMYLLALSLGFRGKYHGVNDAGAIENYKQQLYTFIFQKPADLNAAEKKLFSSAYMHTLEQDAKTVIPGLKRWYGFVALLALSLLGISHLIWMQMTGDIAKIAAQILGS